MKSNKTKSNSSKYSSANSGGNRNRNILIIVVIAVFVIVGAAYAGLLPLPGGDEQAAAGNGQTASSEQQPATGDDQATAGDDQTAGGSEQATTGSKDLVIKVADITEDPTFIPYKGPDYDMEIIAVKASDGTIRTAFNTCQVCYSSGRGYYKVEDGRLVCQNCGNTFGMDDVEVTKGGCNPFPITSEYKTETADTITVPGEFMDEAQVIFENWKTNI